MRLRGAEARDYFRCFGTLSGCKGTRLFGEGTHSSMAAFSMENLGAAVIPPPPLNNIRVMRIW